MGPWGGAFIRVGLIVSVLGAYLAWTLLAADVMYAARRTTTCPATSPCSTASGFPSTPFSGRRSSCQILLAVLFAENALDFTLDLTAALALAPFALASAYAVKMRGSGRVRQHVVGRPHARSGDRGRLDGPRCSSYRGIHVPLPRLHLARPRDGAVLHREAGTEANVFTTPGLVVFLLVLAFAVIGIVLLARA